MQLIPDLYTYSVGRRDMKDQKVYWPYDLTNTVVIIVAGVTNLSCERLQAPRRYIILLIKKYLGPGMGSHYKNEADTWLD